MSASAVCVDAGLDPFTTANLADPYPCYMRLRETAPVVYLPSRNLYLANSFEAASTALRDFRVFSSAEGVGYPRSSATHGLGRRRNRLIEKALLRAPRLTGDLMRLVLNRFGGQLLKMDPYPFIAPFIDVDPPEHTNNRRAVQPFFSKDSIQQSTPMVRGHVVDLIGRALALRTVDAVRMFSAELPARVIADFTGIRAPIERTLDWGDGVFDVMGAQPSPMSREHAAAAAGWLFSHGITDLPDHPDCMAKQVLEHGGAPSGGGKLAAGLDRVSALASIWFAAMDTTASLISNTFNAFADHPAQWRRLREDPELVETAVEEVLRFDAPVRTFYRTATQNTVLCRSAIPTGSRLAVMLASANRDPARFVDPDVFDVGRHPNPNVSFGASIHLCLGAPLARLEAKVLLQEMIPRIKSITRAGAGVRTTNCTTRGFATLPVTLECA